MAYVISAPSSKNTFLKETRGIGLILPITTKFEVTYDYESQMIHNLRNLILTRRGERIMQPLFGTRIYDLLFNNITDYTLQEIRDDILTSINFWMPQVEVNDISVDAILNYNSVKISITVGFNGKQIKDPLTFIFSTQS